MRWSSALVCNSWFFFSVNVYFLFISGAAVGFVLLSSFLSMYVELGVQTWLTIQDTRWVGNWWLGFAIFGVICVFWSIWLLGFPKELPATKKQRDIELSEDAIAAKVVGYFFRMSDAEKSFFSWLLSINHPHPTPTRCPRSPFSFWKVNFQIPTIFQHLCEFFDYRVRKALFCWFRVKSNPFE